MTQLILHLIGDYVTQSDWMAQNKTKRFFPAFAHALVYSTPFLFIASWQAWAIIFSTHYFIDRYRLARYVAWLKNFLAPIKIDDFGVLPFKWADQKWVRPWAECSGTGYHKDTPPFLAVWLMIACDNTMHLAINASAIHFFP